MTPAGLRSFVSFATLLVKRIDRLDMALTTDEFLGLVMENPVVAGLLQRLPALGLEQCYLTAGCLFQTVWNHRSGRPLQAAIKDYDVFYFDDSDLSWEAEDKVIRAGLHLVEDLTGLVEIRNQARVHLWYEQRFGAPSPRLRSAIDGIDRFLIPCTCIGINVRTKEVYAPNGLEDMWDGILSMNPLNPQSPRFYEKAEDYRSRWPWLTIRR